MTPLQPESADGVATRRSSLLERLVTSSHLLQAFRRDRLLLGGFVLGALLVLLPLFQTPFLPQTDLPNQAAMASQVNRLLTGDATVNRFFMLQPHPSPYWLLYALIALLSSFLPLLFALKLIVAATLLSVPLGMMRLLLTLRRSPRMGLWAFIIAWDFSMSMGFIAFCLATSLGLFFLARTVEFAAQPSWKSALVTILLGVTLSFCHAHGAGAIVALAGGLTLAELPNWRRAFRTAVIGLVPLFGLLPWILLGSSSENRAVPARIAVWPDWSERVSRLFHFSLEQVNGVSAKCALAFAFLSILLIPLFLARTGWRRSDRRAFSLYVSAWLVYLLLPSALYWPFFQLLIYERGVTLVLLMGLVLPRRSTGEKPLHLAAAAVAVTLVSVSLTSQFHEFGKRTRPLLEVIDALPSGSTVLPVLYEHRTPESMRETLTQMSAYLIATKGGYSPYLFQTPNLPVRYREAQHLPHPEWTQPNSAHLDKHVRHFDYVLVQGKANRFDEKPRTFGDRRVQLTKVRQTGLWTLYRVASTQVPAAAPAPTATPTAPAAP